MSGQILVVDDLSLSRMVLRAKLASACYNAILASDAQSALALAQAHLPDLILLDNGLPDMSGIALLRQLRAEPRTSDIPVILVTADTSRETRLQALRAGADDVLTKPLDEAMLMSRVRGLLRRDAIQKELRDQAAPALCTGMSEAPAPFPAKPQVALICHTAPADGPDESALASSRPVHDITMTLPEVLSLQPDSRLPDLFLLAPEVALQHGLDVVSELGSRPVTRRIPVVVVLPAGMAALGAMALDLGAADVLRLPLDAEEAALRLNMVAASKSRADALRKAVGEELGLAARDPLTGLFNRRHALARLTELLAARQCDPASPVSVLLVDLDHFKRVNDDLGHSAGDEVLIEATRRMRAVLRAGDVQARYGGEEFLLILPETGLEEAERVAARLCAVIAEAPYALQSGQALLRLTVSVGVATIAGNDTGPVAQQARTLIDCADLALRKAKRAGRNQVGLHTLPALQDVPCATA